MGGGPVLEHMFVPFNWPVSRCFDLPLYTTTLTPGFCGFDVQSPLVGLLSAPQEWTSDITYRNHRPEEASEALVNNDRVQHIEPVQVKESDFQSEVVEKRGELQSEDVEKEGGFQLEGGHEKEGGVQLEEAEKKGRFQPEVVDEKDSEQPELCEEKDVGSDEERRAATLVQARYRGHLVQKTQPLVQLRSIANIEAKLTRLKEQAGSRAFKEELVKEKSMAKLRFEENTLALLMELDNIQGSHPLVREIRKSVVRKIVNLQGTVDAHLAGTGSNRVH